MRILFVSLSYVPSRRASSVQVMNMCAALAARGHEVTLVAKAGDGDGRDVHAFYGVPATFEVARVARPARRGGGAVYAAAVARRIARARGVAQLVYSRDLAGGGVAAVLGVPFVFETHGVPTRPWQRALLRRTISSRACRGVVSISEALRRDLLDEGIVPASAPHVVAHDACDPARIGRAPRAAISTPPRIGYVGNLYRGRGVELIVELARRMPDRRFELVGGSDDDVARVRADGVPANLVLHGFVAPARLGEVYAALDMLLMPFPREGVRAIGGSDTSRWCSPMKMFEYMASGVPMISSDLPVLGEVLHDGENALVAPAADAAAWQAAIERLCADPALRVRLATRAQEDLRRDYTWSARAARVMQGLGLEDPR
jgi:glycosyltransferase involved in cell wall biosynthesis